MTWLFAAPLQQTPSLLIPAFSFSNLVFPARSRAFRSAAISRPIRFSAPRSIARRYCRPLHKCTARNISTPTVRLGSLLIIVTTLMVS